jgi:hypothetical protein
MSDETEFEHFGHWTSKVDPETPKPGAASTAEDEYDPSIYEAVDYQPLLLARNKRQSHFKLVMADQSIFFIYYHDIRDLIFKVIEGLHSVVFTHQSTAVSIKGRNLHYLATMIGEGKLQAIYEPNGMPLSAAHTSPTEITVIRVTVVGRQSASDSKVVGIGSKAEAAKSA